MPRLNRKALVGDSIFVIRRQLQPTSRRHPPDPEAAEPLARSRKALEFPLFSSKPQGNNPNNRLFLFSAVTLSLTEKFSSASAHSVIHRKPRAPVPSHPPDPEAAEPPARSRKALELPPIGFVYLTQLRPTQLPPLYPNKIAGSTPLRLCIFVDHGPGLYASCTQP